MIDVIVETSISTDEIALTSLRNYTNTFKSVGQIESMIGCLFQPHLHPFRI